MGTNPNHRESQMWGTEPTPAIQKQEIEEENQEGPDEALVDDIESVMINLSNKILWETVFFGVIGLDEETLHTILSNIIDQVYENVLRSAVSQLESVEDEVEQQVRMEIHAATREAASRYLAAYMSSRAVNDEFIELVRKEFRRGKKASE